MMSVVVGSCRQSVKIRQYPPGLTTLWHSDSQRLHQYAHDRVSRLSPLNPAYTRFVPVCWYFVATSDCRSPRVNPPDEYGGSVMTASNAASGSDCNTASESPHTTDTGSASLGIIPFRPVGSP